MTIQRLVRDLRARGVVFEPCGDRLAVDPIEKLEPGEIDAIREHKQEILRLFAAGRFERIACPGEECREILFVIDGLAYCASHGMSVRFVEAQQ